MKMTPVESSNLAEVGYDSDRKELAVRFKSGGTHHYVGVEPDRHSGLMSAESHGKYFNQNIKGQYEQKKIGEEPASKYSNRPGSGSDLNEKSLSEAMDMMRRTDHLQPDPPEVVSLDEAVRRFNAPPERP